jgi:catechol 2,3-dioxygenase-like lactoylglutathione lyase family enzyme
MAVRRIVANIASQDMDKARIFYSDILGLSLVMDHGWIVTFASAHTSTAQISIATEGGSGTQVPDLSIEVDNFDEIVDRLSNAGLKPEYGPTSEPWGVRRLYIRDPFDKLVNVLTHDDA